MTSPSTTQLVWLITGTSSGLGRELALAALDRGDRVIATARASSLSQLENLKAKGAETIELDVTAPVDTLKSVAAEAVGIYGRVDVVVNNAGYVRVGAIEENTPEETFDQFNTNLFGALNVTRAFLPYMRERKSGTIVFIGSSAGWATTASVGIYVGTKFAIRGLSSSLHDEISPLGLRSVCIEPGHFRTSFLTEGNRVPFISRIEDYKPITERVNNAFKAVSGKQAGDPKKGAEVIVDLVRGEGSAEGKAFPKTLVIGSDSYGTVKTGLEKRLQVVEEWKEVSKSTDF